jgi:ribosomal protein S20
MKYQDVQMVTSSLDKLGDSLLRNRMMQDQQKARGEDREFKEKEFGLREREVTGRDEDRTENRKLREQVMASQQSQQALGQLQSAYDSIARDYDRGVIDRAEANRRAKALVDQIKSAPEMLLSASPFASMLDAEGDLFQDKPGKPAPELTPSNLEGFAGALTPGGAYVPPDSGKPTAFDTIDYRGLAKQLDDARMEEQAAAMALQNFKPQPSGSFRNRDQQNESAQQRLRDAYTKAAMQRQSIEEQMKQIRGGRGAAASGAPNKQPPAAVDALRAEALAAIESGAPKAAVAARFKEMTGQELQ